MKQKSSAKQCSHEKQEYDDLDLYTPFARALVVLFHKFVMPHTSISANAIPDEAPHIPNKLICLLSGLAALLFSSLP